MTNEGLYLRYLAAQFNLRAVSIEWHPDLGKYGVYVNASGKAWHGMASTIEEAAQIATDKMTAEIAEAFKPPLFTAEPAPEPQTEEDRQASAADLLYQQKVEDRN